MSASQDTAPARKVDRIDVKQEWELCVWARHFNTSERHVKEAVAAVGDRADKVREHLGGRRESSDRPSSR
jgi:hypothetical protein